MKRLKPAHLTKSLHTITSATLVAEFLAQPIPVPTYRNPERLAVAALQLLGHEIDASDKGDPTVTRIVQACARILTNKPSERDVPMPSCEPCKSYHSAFAECFKDRHEDQIIAQGPGDKPVSNMTVTEFRATGSDFPDISVIVPDHGPSIGPRRVHLSPRIEPGRVYLNCLVLMRAPMRGGPREPQEARWFCVIGDVEFDGPLADMEIKLYEYAVTEGFANTDVGHSTEKTS